MTTMVAKGTPKRDGDTKDDEEEVESMEDEEHESEEEVEKLDKAKRALTGRTITLNTLMDDGMIEPGDGVLSIDYLGQRFEADLLPSGKIKWHGSEEVFGTPSAWALHCKRLVNPIKRSGCGWATVKYKNKKLDAYKSQWARKLRMQQPIKSPYQAIVNTPLSTSTAADSKSVSSSSLVSAHLSTNAKKGVTEQIENIQPKLKIGEEVSQEQILHQLISQTDKFGAVASPEKHCSSLTNKDDGPLNLSSLPTVSKDSKRTSQKDNQRLSTDITLKERKCLTYKQLKDATLDIDPHTLVRCEEFSSLDQTQPFTVDIASNAMLLMDFHCHLTKSEVVGYLAGVWDSQKKHLSVERVFPMQCRLSDKERAPVVEDEIKRNMNNEKLSLVGWYHSHPYCQAEPSMIDLDSQICYQQKLRRPVTFNSPCVGFIVAPFEKSVSESNTQAFFVLLDTENASNENIPMKVTYSRRRDASLTEGILSDMKRLSEFYSGAPDKVRFKERWKEQTTYMEKIKDSLSSKLPEDQLETGTFLGYMQQLLLDMK